MKTIDDLRKRLMRPDQGDAPMAVGTEGFTAEQANLLHVEGFAKVWRCECCGVWLIKRIEPST